MRVYNRRASACWQGDRLQGKGSASTVSHALRAAPFRFSARPEPLSATNPPELLAAAHATSFSAALAGELEKAGHRPVRIDITATVTVEEARTRWTLTQVHLEVKATVPGVGQCDFVDATLRAKTSCPICRLSNANISVEATLEKSAKPVLAARGALRRGATPVKARANLTRRTT